MGHVIWRLFAALFGYLAASLAAGFALTFLFAHAADVMDAPAAGVKLMFLSFAAAMVAGSLAAPAAVIAIAVAELNSWRNWLYYTVAGALAGLAGIIPADNAHAFGQDMAIFIISGAAAGWVYWLVAGRGAGRRQAPAPAPQDAPERTP